MPKNFYEVLNVEPSATPKEIRKAYKKLANIHHPDKNDSPDTHEKFQDIEEAYRVLKDPINRAYYDDTGEADLPKVEKMASNKLLNLFSEFIKMAVVAELETGGDSFSTRHGMNLMLTAIEKDLNNNIERSKTNIKTFNAATKKLRKIHRKIGIKGEMLENLFIEVVESQIKATSGALANAAVELEAYQMALANLKDYEVVVEETKLLTEG